MKIYTGRGDRGRTSLFSGEQVPKYSRRVETYGTIDELNAVLGVVTAHLGESEGSMVTEINRIQRVLLHAGAWVATEPGSTSSSRLKPFDAGHVDELEQAIDAMDSTLPEISGFILPGGHCTASHAQVARTVCRRAERRFLELISDEDSASSPDPSMMHIQVFLNRLSDYLFVLSRFLNKRQGHDDILWKE